MIKVNHLHKYFNRFKKNEIHVLNDINLEFPEKGLVVLLGPSGSGKTTLLNVLGGLDKVQSGTIDFDHTQIEGYDAGTWEKIRNEAVGYIFQNYNLLPELSVFDNVAFVLKMIGIHDPQVIEDRVHYILNAVNMFPFRKKRALQLSGGQQQRVAIARALVKNPRIIIADEPTGNLDSKNTLEIMNIIKQISMEKLVVLVTHERDIANFYGDRIIELKDGQIISDTDNEVDHDHSFANDDVIYLKDLNLLADNDLESLKAALYKDHQEDEEPITVRLIVKNKTLYLDVNSPYQKVKLIDKNSGVVIKDEHYVKKTREQLIETSFDLSVLDNKEVHRQPKLLVSLKQIIWMALVKISKTSRKGKIMLFSFLIAGMVIAFTISFLASVVVLEPEKYIDLGTDYVKVNTYDEDNFMTYDELVSYGEDDDHFAINTFTGYFNFEFLITSDIRQNSIYSRLDYATGIKKSDLLRGNVPDTPYEALLSKALAEDIIKGSNGQNLGIWSMSHLLQEKIDFGEIVLDIVGIVDAEQRVLYLDPMVAQYVYDFQQMDTQMTGYELFEDDLDILLGTLPVGDQVMISQGRYNLYPSVHALPFPKTVPGVPFPVSGVFTTDKLLYSMLSPFELAEEARYDKNREFFIRTSDKKALIDDLVSEYPSVKATDLLDEALIAARGQRDIVLYSSLGTAGFIVGFALLGFYFIIRSSLISRIYEISVYRALGVRKKEIFRSFIVEIIVLTSLSTLIGYVLASLAISYLQEGLLGQLNLFKINFLTFIAGLVVMYTINILAGLFPVYMLLRKTPAQILSQYDI
jgi:ABC-type lipoprotein export system ATPase subunit/cell division protein FtsX